MPEDNPKVGVSMEELNEVRASLEPTMDTKLGKIEAQIAGLTAIIENMARNKPPVEIVEERGPLTDPAKLIGAGGGGPSDKHAENSESSTPRKPGDYTRVSPFQSADPPINHPHVNSIGDPPKVNANDFERWQ